ncbi:Protein of unknown function (DUF2680) [Desulfosporosinus orientis DSM 765]|uniref:DUF2680 domain-containing protein n=1 Tax=Desulfosporosinus orientis (strain ATCC 19365 / DSM 765 / NCIMB 8382 / VKM B-1628 / Singapore I) TaxID=768706 RepID=G7WDZ9_DESOD|nr:DUF2680 domain-containing protein [Desulfosporosinus orientis]AET69397.1 Protein of unknown function (DUF2680) [Desulfosporosinus orientis DSM 765]
MKKKLAVGVLSAVLLAGGTTAVFGATDTSKLDEIKSLTQQMFSIQKQIIDKEVDAGLRTAEQADIMKKSIDKRQEASDKALAEGKVFGPGMGGKDLRMLDNAKQFFSKEPMTEEQIQAWSEAAQARIEAQVEAMKENGKLTDEQIQTWHDAALAQLKVQVEAMKNGTFVPGGMGMPMGKHGGHGDRSWGNKTAPDQSTSSDTSSTTNVQ